jgi:hypothetical protein
MSTGKRILSLAAVLALAVCMFAAVAGMLQPKPAQAEMTTPNLIVFADGMKASGVRAYTTTFTTTAQYIGNRTLLQYFMALDMTSYQTVTMKVQASADNSAPWADIVSISAGSVDTTVAPSQVNAVGTYIRAVVSAGSTNTFTPTFKVVLK